jgi:tRNA-(ms[2]io[6]A)-hydroxylase
MLNLRATTRPEWITMVIEHLDEVVIDHAHCEKKAAGTAMNLIFAYVVQSEFVRQLSDIVVEELEHFRQVLDLIEARGWKFRGLAPSNYGRQLHALVRTHEPARAIDRCLIAALIEARSCERFALLRDQLPDRSLAEFYGSLFESEARHHATYVRMARLFGSEEEVFSRLEELSWAEAEIITRGDTLPRIHS